MIKNKADALNHFIRINKRWNFAYLSKTNRLMTYVMNGAIWDFYEGVMGWKEGTITNAGFGGPDTAETTRQREWMHEGEVLFVKWFLAVKKELKELLLQQKEQQISA